LLIGWHGYLLFIVFISIFLRRFSYEFKNRAGSSYQLENERAIWGNNETLSMKVVYRETREATIWGGCHANIAWAWNENTALLLYVYILATWIWELFLTNWYTRNKSCQFPNACVCVPCGYVSAKVWISVETKLFPKKNT